MWRTSECGAQPRFCCCPSEHERVATDDPEQIGGTKAFDQGQLRTRPVVSEIELLAAIAELSEIARLPLPAE